LTCEVKSDFSCEDRGLSVCSTSCQIFLGGENPQPTTRTWPVWLFKRNRTRQDEVGESDLTYNEGKRGRAKNGVKNSRNQGVLALGHSRTGCFKEKCDQSHRGPILPFGRTHRNSRIVQARWKPACKGDELFGREGTKGGLNPNEGARRKNCVAATEGAHGWRLCLRVKRK